MPYYVTDISSTITKNKLNKWWHVTWECEEVILSQLFNLGSITKYAM